MRKFSNTIIRTLFIVTLGLIFTGCLGGNEDAPVPTDSQTGNLPPPIYGTSPSPIDTESNVLGPWFFKSTNFELTRTTTDFTIGNLAPGRYKLKIQNGNYGPFLARTCAALTDTAQKRQCLYDNLIEKTTQEFTRTEKSKGSLNGSPLFAGKTLTRSFAYKEESVQLQTTNQFLIDVQAFPTASLKMAIDYAEEFATPVALFSVNSLSGTAPATIKFNAIHSYDADNADTLTYEWNFGDGETATGLSANHVYSAAGTYTARLKVTDQTGRFDEFSAEIFIKAPGTPPPATNKNPVLKLAITYPDPENLRKINVSLAQSYDTDGLVTAYSIDFSDGTKVSASEIEHTYAKDGTYLLKVTITDDLGGKASLTESLSISTTNDLIAAAKIYGTKTYYGDIIGERRVTDTFQIPAQDLNAIYKLTIKNADGLPHDQKSCSGTSGAALLSCQYDNLVNKTYIATQRLDYVNAYLNGKLLTDSSAINKSNYIFSTVIAPQEANTLEIRMKGYPTAYAQIYIEKMQVADNTPPILSLRSPRPEENYYSNQSPTNIQVVVDSNKVLTSGTINGVAARVLDGSILVASVPFAVAGRNQIQASATDLEGNTVSTSFGFDLIRDQVAPQIQINYADNSTTNKTVIDLPITITDSSPTTTSISLNGQELFITTAKNFTTPITLPFEGENIITVQSADAAGNASGAYSLRVNRDTTPPMLILSHTNGAVIKEIMFNYSGTANEPMAYVRMNGYSLNLNSAQNGFSDQFVGENLGYYTLNFEYADLYGNVGTSTIQVRLIGKLINQALVTLNPDPDGEHIWVIGNHSAARPNARVNAYQGLFNMNRGTATAQSNGAFAIKLKLAPAVTVSVFDSEFNEEVQFDLYANLNTTITGVIKDYQNNVLPNVSVMVSGGNQAAMTDGNGVFQIQDPPTGDQLLIIDGSAVTQSTIGVQKKYSTTKLAVNIGIGQNNSLAYPIYLAPMLLDGTESVIQNGAATTVVSSHAEGVQLDIPSDKVIFPDGTNSGAINLITVESDKITTAVPSNFIPTKALALEPSGLQFKDRIKLTLPNDNELPANTEMAILSMDSSRGMWTVDGVAKVSADGQKIETKPNLGISHFSTIYAVPMAPLIAAVKNPNLIGIDISQGSLSNVIQSPKFKIYGQEVVPSLIYKSNWANPTALVSNIFEIPSRRVSDDFSGQRITYEDGQDGGFVPTRYLIQREYNFNIKRTNVYVPDRIKSQFFISRTASDAINTSNTVLDDQITQLQGTPISNAEATSIIEQTGIPNRAVISYAVELIDSSTGNYFQSGIYPTLARYEIRLKNLTISTNTYSLFQTIGTNTLGISEIRRLPPDIVRRVETTIDSRLLNLLPQDLTENIMVQNKVNSNAGRGWHIGGAQRIINPTNSKIMIEEANGDVATYATNNTLTTLFHASNTTIDLNGGVDFNGWPKALAANANFSTHKSYVAEIDLSSEGSSIENVFELPSTTGSVANQGAASCEQDFVCGPYAPGIPFQPFGCRFELKGTLQPTTSNFYAKFNFGGVVRSGAGDIYLTDTRQHAFYKVNGATTKLQGSTAAVDEYVKAVKGSYFNEKNETLNSACVEIFGFECTNTQTVSIDYSSLPDTWCYTPRWYIENIYYEPTPVHSTFYSPPGTFWYTHCFRPHQSDILDSNNTCKLASDHKETRMTFGGGNGGDTFWRADYVIADKVEKFHESTGQIGSIGAGEEGLNNPTYVLGGIDGRVYFSDTGNNRVRVYDPSSGNLSTFAGDGRNIDIGEKVPALEAGINHPKGLAQDLEGNIYVSTEKGYIKKIDSGGIITTFAGKPLELGGVVSDEAPADSIFLSSPEGLVFDTLNKYLYVADGIANKIFRINLITKTVSLVAGNGHCIQGDIGDGSPALLGSICKPTYLGLDDQKNLLFVDSGHKRIRRINFINPTSGLLAFAPSNKDLSKLYKNPDGSWTRQYRNGNFDYFNQDGFQIQSADRVGRTTSFQYDGDQNLSRVNFPNGQYIQYNYTMNKLQSIVDPAGRMTSFMYAGEFLNQVNFPDGTNRKFFYDIKGQMTSERDQRDNETRYTYNEWNRISQVRKPDGSIVTMNDIASQTVSNSYTVGNVGAPKSQDSNDGQVSTTITDAKSSVTKMREDFMGFYSEIIDSQDNVTIINRDLSGRPIEIKRGKYIASTDPDAPKILNPLVSHSTVIYEAITGDLLKSKDEILGLEETKLYDQYGNVISETNAKNQTVIKAYDPLNGLLMQVTYPLGNAEGYAYNQKGQVTQKITQNGAANILTTYEYDTNGRMTKVIDNGGKYTRFVYDNAGNQIQSISTTNGTDQLVTNYEYDAFNRLTKVTSPKNEVTMYEYLATGELSKITDPSSNVTVFNYDQMGRLISKTDPLGNTFQFAYDGNGNRTQEIDPNSNTKTYTYDSLNRMIQANFPDDSVQYQYDEKGEVIFAANSVSQMNVVKDSKQRVTRATLTGLNSMSAYPTIDLGYDYDAADNRTAMSSVYGNIGYSYDDNNRLTNITNTWGGGFDYNYDIAGRLTSIARPGGNSSFTYTDSGALAKIEHIGNNQVQNYFEYFYDQRNFPTTKRSPAGDSNYSYDDNGQLTQATSPSLPTESFSYDSLGNRTADEARAYGYDSKGQRLLDDGVYLYQYDGNGNVTSQLPKDINSTADAYRFTYSSKNQLIKTEVFAGSLGAKIREVNYVYDVLGRRMQKTVQDFVETSSVLKNFTRKYGYDGQNIFVEFDQDNNLLARHTHNPLTLDDILSTEYTSHAVNAQVAQYAGNFYYLKDHLGSIMDITDSSGNVVQRYDYKSFGKLISTTDASGTDISASPVVRNSFTYTGREWEEETSMFYYRARWYSPTTGRFLQSDPDPGKLINPTSIFNKYTYVSNNPIQLTDPTGRLAFLIPLFAFVVNLAVATLIGAMIGGMIGGVLGFAFGGGTWESFANGFAAGFQNAAIFTAATFTGGAAFAAIGLSGAGLTAANFAFGAAVGGYQGYQNGGGPLGALLGVFGGGVGGVLAGGAGAEVGAAIRNGGVNTFKHAFQMAFGQFESFERFVGGILEPQVPDVPTPACQFRMNCLSTRMPKQ